MRVFRPVIVMLAIAIVAAATVTGCEAEGRREYTLSVSCIPAEGGTVYGPMGVDNLKGPFYEGEEFYLFASPNIHECYEFDYWSGDVSCNVTPYDSDKTFINWDSNKTIVAHFRKSIEGRVWTKDGSYIAQCSKPIILVNNPSAANPTYAQLLSFLKQDRTEANPYTGGCNSAILCPPDKRDVLEALNKEYEEAKAAGTVVDRPSVCSEYAEMLHNNAEKAGIRAGYVLCTDHAMNVFEAVDKGLIYIDDTGSVWSFDGIDKLATVGADGRIRLAPLWPEDQAKYTSVDFPNPVYCEATVWWGGSSAKCQT